MARINFLPPWVETNLQPAFYDLESGTCLQQTARMYDKVNQLVRSVNDQNETIADYIQQFIDLKDYVEDYFENLDVQEEINNKLDAMVEDGTMATIINGEIFSELNAKLNRVINDKVLLIGDSYLQGYNGETTVNGWGVYFNNCAGLSASNIKTLAESGAGFLKQGNDGHTFKTLLQANIDSISNKEDYTSIIIGFGLNDQGQGSSGQITVAIGEFVTYAKSQFPNATIYLGLVGYSKKVDDGHPTIRTRIYERCYIASQLSSQYGVKYLNGVEQVAHDYTLFGADDIHLSQDGYKALGYAIYQSWKTGNVKYHTVFSSSQTITAGGDLASASGNFSAQVRLTGENRQIVLSSFNISFTAFEVANASIALTASGEMSNNSLFRNSSINNPSMYLNVQFTLSDNSTLILPCYLCMNNTTGGLDLKVPSTLNGSTIKQIRSLIGYTFNMPTILS